MRRSEQLFSSVLDALPALVVRTDSDGRIEQVWGEVRHAIKTAPQRGAYLGTIFSQPAAIFLETHLWPLLRRMGRIDECYAPMEHVGGEPWPCFVSARTMSDGAGQWFVWLLFPATERARFESELIQAKAQAQRLTETLRVQNWRLDTLARTDPLTGLGNRRALDKAFVHSLHSVVGNGKRRDGALLLIDVDYFKKINDKFGHDIGDEVLVRLAGCMRDCVRRSDTVVRLGGEEFALWLPDASVDAALKIARKVHDRVSAIRLPDGESRVTVSIGVAVSTGGEATGDLRGMLRCADRALYRAKEAGRNCTRVDHGDFGLSTDGAADQSG